VAVGVDPDGRAAGLLELRAKPQQIIKALGGFAETAEYDLAVPGLFLNIV
jgi:hypothetical protein